MSNFVLIVIEPHKSFKASDSNNSMVKTRYYYLNISRILLANKNDNLMKISCLIRTNLSVQFKPNESVFIFCNNYSCGLGKYNLNQGVTIGEVHAQLSDPEDGILYLKYAREESFGCETAYF